MVQPIIPQTLRAWVSRNLEIRARRHLRKRGYLVQKRPGRAPIQAVIDLLKPQASTCKLVRIGRKKDGGYIVPDDLEWVGACFLPGVANKSSFEAMLSKRFAIPGFLADASVDGPPDEVAGFDFEKLFLGQENDQTHIRLEDWVARKDPDGALGDRLLQMDIERAEYGVIAGTPREILNRFRIIVLELHGLHRLAERGSLTLLEVMFRKLTSTRQVVHFHPNNFRPAMRANGVALPRFLEVTLLRHDRSAPSGDPLVSPHALDRRNIPQKPEVGLPKARHRN